MKRAKPERKRKQKHDDTSPVKLLESELHALRRDLRAAGRLEAKRVVPYIVSQILGAIGASLGGGGEFAGLVFTIRWGVTGFFLGLALVVLLSVSLRRKDLVSIRGMMVLVAIAGVLSWFFARILFGVIGY